MFKFITGGNFDLPPVSTSHMTEEPAVSGHAGYRRLGVLTGKYVVSLESRSDANHILPSVDKSTITAARPDHYRILDYCKQAETINPSFLARYVTDPSAFEIVSNDLDGRHTYSKSFDQQHYQAWMRPILPEVLDRESAYEEFSAGSTLLQASLANGIAAKSGNHYVHMGLKQVLDHLLAIPSGGLVYVVKVLERLNQICLIEPLRYRDYEHTKKMVDAVHTRFVSQLTQVRQIREKHIEDLVQEFSMEKTENIVKSWDHSDSQALKHIDSLKAIDAVTLKDMVLQEALATKMRKAGVTLSGHVLELSRIAERRVATGFRGDNDIPNQVYPDSRSRQGPGSSSWELYY